MGGYTRQQSRQQGLANQVLFNIGSGSSVMLTTIFYRYRDAVQYDRRHPLLRTLAIPSTLLDRHKLELLIHEATIPTDPTVPFRESITNVLVPTLATPSSASGRASIITYPVHKSILYGEGLDALGAISNIIYGITEKHHNMIFGVASVTWRIADRSPSNVSLVNVEEGQEAIRSLRESSSNSSKYEHCWLASNLSLVSSFISEGDAGDAPVKPALANLISTVASHAEEAISLEKSRYREALDTATVSSETRQSLESAISYWAELAHTELRDELERVFHAPSWRKLTWWKLPWTVDDIPIIASEALHRAYLIEAEMGIIWVSGRLQEAGLIPPFEPKLSAEKAQPFFEARDLEVGDIVPDLAPGSHHNLKAMRPWPLQIAASRTTLLQTLPPLQATAQRLLLEGLSTTSLGLTISFLVYLSVSTTSIYETGAVASLALAWSARRVQVQWERAKRQWIDSVVSEGKQTLDAVERSCRSIVQQGGRPEEDVAAAEQRVRAREAVEGIRRSLSKVVKG